MLKVLVTCAVYMVCLFILVLVLCLMVWVIIRLLRWLFPQRFGPKVKPLKKPKKVKKVVRVEDDEDEEDDV